MINDPTFHEVAYGLMVFALTVQGFYCIKYVHYMLVLHALGHSRQLVGDNCPYMS